MKKILVAMIISVLLLGTAAYAEEDAVVTSVPVLFENDEAQPILISERIDTPVLYAGDGEFIETELLTDEALIMDGVALISEMGQRQIYVNDQLIELDVPVQVIDGVTMLPLRLVAEALGYKVTWNADTESIDLNKGAQFTSVTLGENAYFKNRMAKSPLSAAPLAAEGRTLVPVEFFYTILNQGFVIDSGDIYFNEDDMMIHSGYVQSIQYDETGLRTMTIGPSLEETSDEVITIIISNSYFCIDQKEVFEGDFVNVISPGVMAMVIPAQTTGNIVY